MEIHVLGRKVRLLQPEKGFRTSLDSVMAAAACPVKNGQSVLDMGCGVGAVAFCILHRVPDAHVTGVDIQEDYVDLARKNIALNKPQPSSRRKPGSCVATEEDPGFRRDDDARADFICSDIRDYTAETRFDHIVCNPPFLEAGHYTPSPQEGLAKARGHDDEGIDVKDWIDAGFRNLRSGGSLTMIHRADSVDRIIQALGRRFGAVEIIPLWPHAGEAAKRAIVRAVKDRKTPAVIHAGIVLHKSDGTYTPEADKILRDGENLT